MRIVATSDLHGRLPRIPSCDLLLIAGDVCPLESHAVAFQRRWLERTFAAWISGPSCRAEKVVWIAGNHDFALMQGGPGSRLGKVATYLQDSGVEVGGVKIHGTPWTKVIGPWAFSLVDRGGRPPPGRPGPGLDAMFGRIPDDADVVLCHSPPYGILDRHGRAHLGSRSLLNSLRAAVPRLVVFGHAHQDYGRRLSCWKREGGRRQEITFANVAHLDDRYRVANDPQIIEIAKR